MSALSSQFGSNQVGGGSTFGQAVDYADKVVVGDSIKVKKDGETVKELVNPTTGDILILEQNSEKVVRK